MDKVIISILALGLSTYCWAWLITSIDHFEREPWSYLSWTFLWGAIPGLSLSFGCQWLCFQWIDSSLGFTLDSQLLESAVVAPLSEELAKGIVIAIIYGWFRHEFDGWVDGIVYGAMVGLGFNFMEDLPGLILTHDWSTWSTLFIADGVNGGAHAFYTALTGIGFGIARYAKTLDRQVVAIGSGFVAAVVTHGINNGSVVMINAYFGQEVSSVFDWMYVLNYWGLAFLLGLLWVVADRVERLRLQIYLEDEVPDVINPRLYEHICGKGTQALSELGLDHSQRALFIQTVAELAQKKFQLRTMGDEKGHRAEIQLLRDILKHNLSQASVAHPTTSQLEDGSPH